MLRIEQFGNGATVFRLIGRMNAGNVAEVQALLQSEGKDRQIVLDLKDLTLVDRGAVRFLERCEAQNITIANCPAYIREWIERERNTARPRLARRLLGGPETR